MKGKPIRILCSHDLTILRDVGQHSTGYHAEGSKVPEHCAHRQLVLVIYDPVHDGILWCWMRDFLSSFKVSFLKFSLPTCASNTHSHLVFHFSQWSLSADTELILYTHFYSFTSEILRENYICNWFFGFRGYFCASLKLQPTLFHFLRALQQLRPSQTHSTLRLFVSFLTEIHLTYKN